MDSVQGFGTLSNALKDFLKNLSKSFASPPNILPNESTDPLNTETNAGSHFTELKIDDYNNKEKLKAVIKQDEPIIDVTDVSVKPIVYSAI